MRALVLPESGSAPTLVDLDIPEPAAGEIRVKVHAASVNGFDLAVAGGYTAGMMEHRYPLVIGKDFAGTVDAIGADVAGYELGDRVFGVVTKPYLGDGSFGEYVTVPVEIGLARIPGNIDFATAAAFGLAGTAAVDSFDGAGVKPGDVVLVAGATGGVGNQVVQLAVAAGAHVIATAHSEEERAQVTALGATEIVDYTEDVAAQVRATHPDGVDAVVHLAGDSPSLGSLVKPGGRFVTTLGAAPDTIGAEVVGVPIMATPTPATLDRLAHNHATGATTLTVQEVFPLEKVADAFAAFGKGTLGKLVIELA